MGVFLQYATLLFDILSNDTNILGEQPSLLLSPNPTIQLLYLDL